MSTWILEDELSEMDTITANATYRLTDIMKQLSKLIRNPDPKRARKIAQLLEPAVSPLNPSYPCKLYFELLYDSLVDYANGVEDSIESIRSLVEILENKWPHNCPS